GEVDSWFGAPELRQAAGKGRSPADLLVELDTIEQRLQELQEISPRRQRLQQKLTQLGKVLELLDAGQLPPFAEEARQLYGIELPDLDHAAMRQTIFDELS